jgi:hypothetical protein
VYVVHGNGDGTFALPRTTLAAAENGTSGDFDGDGDDDIALPGAVAWNDGDNTFRVAPTGDPRLQRPVRAADVDGDGKAEVVSIRGGAVSVLSLRPDGSIVEVAELAVAAEDVAVGDFTGQHRPEIAAVGANVLRVFEIRNGAAPRYTFTLGNTAWSVAAADLNHDGRDDLIVAGGTLLPPYEYHPTPSGSKDGFLSTFLSNGSSFDAERKIALPLIQFVPYVGLSELVTGDFDGDGKIDAAAAGLHYPGKVLAFYGDGAGGFGSIQQIEPSRVEVVNHLRAADLDGDGRTDLAVNGAWRIYAGTAEGLVERRRYLSPQSPDTWVDDVTFVPLLVRPHRGALPWIITPTQFSADAYVYRSLCPRERAARHGS